MHGTVRYDADLLELWEIPRQLLMQLLMHRFYILLYCTAAPLATSAASIAALLFRSQLFHSPCRTSVSCSTTSSIQSVRYPNFVKNDLVPPRAESFGMRSLRVLINTPAVEYYSAVLVPYATTAVESLSRPFHRNYREQIFFKFLRAE